MSSAIIALADTRASCRSSQALSVSTRGRLLWCSSGMLANLGATSIRSELPVQKLAWAPYGYDGNRRNARHRYGPGKRGIPFKDPLNSARGWPRLHTQRRIVMGQDSHGVGTAKSNDHQDKNP